MEGHEEVFQHPIKGFVIDRTDDIGCYALDIGQGPSRKDARIYVGVEVFRARCELGAWLNERHPDDAHKIINHLFVEEVFPCEFEDTDDETGRARDDGEAQP